MNIEIDWEYFLETNTFARKGTVSLVEKTTVNENTINSFLLLCASDPKVEEKYKFAEAYKKAVEVFKNEQVARKWMIDKHHLFYNKPPLEHAIMHGSYTLIQFLNEKGKTQ